MPNGVCKPYKFSEEFQRIRDYIDGGGPSGDVQFWDVSCDNRVSVSGTAYEEILSYTVPVNKTVYLYDIFVSLIGFSAEFIVEVYYVGTGWKEVRTYITNVYKPDGGQKLASPILLEDYGGSTKVRVRVKMNGGAGDNLKGLAYAALNGFITKMV